MGNQQQYRHLYNKNKLSYDDNGIYYVQPNKVQNSYYFNNYSQLNTESKLIYSHNKAKSNVQRNIFNQNINIDNSAVKSVMKRRSNIKLKQQENKSIQQTNKNTLKHQKNYSFSNLQNNSKYKSINKPFQQITNNINKNSIQKYDLNKIFGEYNIDTKRAIGDSNLSYINALDSKIDQQLQNQQYQQIHFQKQKDQILSTKTKKNIVSHCDLIKPDKYSNQCQNLHNQIQQTRRRQYSLCQFPLQRNLQIDDKYDNKIEIYNTNCINNQKNNQHQISPFKKQYIYLKDKEQSIFNNQLIKDHFFNKQRTKTQISTNQIQNSRFKLKKLQQQIKVLKEQILKQKQDKNKANQDQYIIQMETSRTNFDKKSQKINNNNEKHNKHKKIFDKKRQIQIFQQLQKEHHKNNNFFLNDNKNEKIQQNKKFKQSIKERIKQLKSHNNDTKKISIQQCTQMKLQSKTPFQQHSVCQYYKQQNEFNTFRENSNNKYIQNQNHFSFNNQKIKEVDKNQLLSNHNIMPQQQQYKSQLENQQIITYEKEIRNIEMKYISKINKEKSKKYYIRPPIEQFLSTEPICQQVLKSDHLSIIKQFQLEQNNQNNITKIKDDKHKKNSQKEPYKSIQQSFVKSFQHNKSSAYFDIDYTEEQWQ